MHPADNVEKTIRDMHLTTSAKTDERILADSYAALERGTQTGAGGRVPTVHRIRLTSPIVTVGAVAAALMIVAAFLVYSSGPEPIKLTDVYQTVAKVSAIRISRFMPGEDRPYQQQYVSRMLNVNMTRLADTSVLWDLDAAISKTKRATSSNVRVDRLGEEMLARLNERMHDVFDIVPFSHPEDMTSNVRWTRVEDRSARSVVPDADVYDLAWTVEQPQEETRKRRYYVDRQTNRPLRVEFYARTPAENTFRFLRYEVIEYPADSEIRETIREEFDTVPDSNAWNNPEYIGTPESP